MFLDYSRSAARKSGPLRWVRAIWSHQTRVDLAQSASGLQGVALLAVISVAAVVLTITPPWLYAILSGIRQGGLHLGLSDRLAHGSSILVNHVLVFGPICFGGLILLVAVLAQICVWLSRQGRSWPHCFAAVSVACMPVLWFFMLLQAEALAPFGFDQDLWHGPWNPITNHVRFLVLITGLILLSVWIIDTHRLYHSLRACAPAPHPTQPTGAGTE